MEKITIYVDCQIVLHDNNDIAIYINTIFYETDNDDILYILKHKDFEKKFDQYYTFREKQYIIMKLKKGASCVPY